MGNSLQILNFIPDEKFIDVVIENHDSGEDDVRHYYVIVIASNITKESFSYAYIKKQHRIELIFENEILNFINKNGINAIILHSLNTIPINVLSLIDESIPILWNAWGSDIYQRPYALPFVSIKNLYYPNTRNILYEIGKKRKGKLKNLLGSIKKYLIQNHLYTPQIIRNDYSALKRINFFSGIIDLEYDFMRQVNGFQAKRATYVYGPLSYKINSSRCNGNNILLGNSGNPTNNHIDIIQILKHRGIDDVRIISPLNYGGDNLYINSVCEIGMELLGNNFQPLTIFLPKMEYTNCINSCGNVIIGSMRQQAMGNISMAIAMGCKIYLYKESILYKYFKQKGYIIFSIEDDLSKESISVPLSENDVNYNRALHHKIQTERWNPKILKRLYTQFREFNANSRPKIVENR